jgi:hypothetical protein
MANWRCDQWLVWTGMVIDSITTCLVQILAPALLEVKKRPSGSISSSGQETVACALGLRGIPALLNGSRPLFGGRSGRERLRDRFAPMASMWDRGWKLSKPHVQEPIASVIDPSYGLSLLVPHDADEQGSGIPGIDPHTRGRLTQDNRRTN